MNLTKAQQDALISAEPRQGAKPQAPVSVLLDLMDLRLIGASHGLTRKGTTERAKIMRRREDESFS